MNYYNTAKQGLVSANKGNPFWSKADAMQTINMTRANGKRVTTKYLGA